jgi:hypothetical protein
MTDVAPGTTRGLSRRALLRSGLVAGLGAAAVTVAVPGVAQAATYNSQLGWGWCSKCQALFFLAPATDMNRSNGVCPAGGKHGQEASDIYWMYYAFDPIPNNFQNEWNWCNKCQGLFYLPYIQESACPAGGNHSNILNNELDSYNYGLYYGGVSGYQPNWLYCNYCRSLFYCENPVANDYKAGICPGNVILGTDFFHYGYPSYNYDVVPSGGTT